MSLGTLFLLDLVAITVLVFAIYFPRRRRREMIVALLGVNVGVLAVTQALSSAGISAGLGLGLFGVLSIIRLRSTEVDHAEVAYYFAALTLGLLGGFVVSRSWLNPVLMGGIVAAVFIGDHPNLLGHYRRQVITLDRAYPDEREAAHRVEKLLGGQVRRLTIRKLDFVNDTTIVDVCYQLDPGAGRVVRIDVKRL